MRQLLGGRLGIAGQRVPAQVDARRQHQPVIGKPLSVAERDCTGGRVNCTRCADRERYAIGGDLAVTELLRRKIAQSCDNAIAERASGEGLVRLHQSDGDARIGPSQGARGARAGKAAAHYNDAWSGLRDSRPSKERGRSCKRSGRGKKRTAARAIYGHDVVLAQCCSAYQAAMACTSASEKPLAMRSMTVAGRWPARKACICATISAAFLPTSGGTGD